MFMRLLEASLFGSYAREEASTKSNLDLLVTLAPGKTYLELGGLQYHLEQKIHRGVDITRKLNQRFKHYFKKTCCKFFSS